MNRIGVSRVAALGFLMLLSSVLHAAGQELPDELTLNVGAVEGVGTNVTVVLTKRSVRSDNYLCFLWTDDGFKKLDPFPVSTYRGYKKDDPLMRVNGNIEPDGTMNFNFTENRMIIGRVRDLKVPVPQGKCTPTMSTGNQVVPLASVSKRQVPTAGGYLVPQVPMRRTRWTVQAPKTYTEQFELEKVVSQIEQRWNDGDFIYARDMGTAWEIETMVLIDPKSTQGPDFATLCPDEPGRKENSKFASCSGVMEGHNQGKQRLSIIGNFREARILLHESAHVYGNPLHQAGEGDGLCGGGAFWDVNNVALLVESMKSLNETNYPAVLYNGELPPRATYDFACTGKDTPVTVDVLENDYDGRGEPISLQAVAPKSAKGGTVSISADGKALYTPPPGFVGPDRFSYTVVNKAGVANRSGVCKVDVRGDGLAVWFNFAKAEVESLERLRKAKPLDEGLSSLDQYDSRPAAEKFVYYFRNQGPYGDERGSAYWIDYAPVQGVRDLGLLNTGRLNNATADLGPAGDPGRNSLSASVWVLYPPQATQGGRVILCKGGTPWEAVNGWAIGGGAIGGQFTFSGNTVRLLASEAFKLQSEEKIEPNRWYHLVMVMDRETRTLRAWVNNREVIDPKGQARIPDGAIEYFGALHLFNGYGGKWWSGTCALVDEVKIFTSALTPAQVAELYAEGKDAKLPDLPKLAVKAAK